MIAFYQATLQKRRGTQCPSGMVSCESLHLQSWSFLWEATLTTWETDSSGLQLCSEHAGLRESKSLLPPTSTPFQGGASNLVRAQPSKAAETHERMFGLTADRKAFS